MELNFKNFIFYNNYFNANCLYFIIFKFLVHCKSDKYFEYIRRNVVYKILFWKIIDIIYFFVRDNIKNVKIKKNRLLRRFAEL